MYTLSELEIIKMYKAFIQPYLMYAIEVWGHSLKSEADILVKLQSKVLRIIYYCKRSDDAWRNNNCQIKSVNELYELAIGKICLKHHLGLLSKSFACDVMPHYNIDQLSNKITRVSLCQMYNYRKVTKLIILLD